MRIGFGTDIHRLVEGRKLVLAGVNVPAPFGELAHSDGDVVYHALMDAILGALALGDIGKHFPDNDDLYKNIDSAILVKKVYELMKTAHKVSVIHVKGHNGLLGNELADALATNNIIKYKSLIKKYSLDDTYGIAIEREA